MAPLLTTAWRLLGFSLAREQQQQNKQIHHAHKHDSPAQTKLRRLICSLEIYVDTPPMYSVYCIDYRKIERGNAWARREFPIYNI